MFCTGVIKEINKLRGSKTVLYDYVLSVIVYIQNFHHFLVLSAGSNLVNFGRFDSFFCSRYCFPIK